MNGTTISLVSVLCALLLAGSFKLMQEGPDEIPTASLVRHTAVVVADTVAVQRAAIMAAAGRNAVAYINAARDELRAENPTGARRFMAQAEGILVQIRNGLQEEAQDRKHRIPLWAEVSLSDIRAVPEALQSRLAETRRLAVRGRHGRVIEDLTTMEVKAVYSYIDMPLDRTLARLQAAREAVESGDRTEALRFLVAATDGLLSETVQIGAGDATPRQTSNESDRS